jgi:hypothetical protein
MGMFDTYDNLDPSYIPDNTSPKYCNRYVAITNKLPRPVYDKKKRFIGYTWDYGDVFDFTISVDDVIKVKQDSLIFNNPGEKPDNSIVGDYIGQQAYNTVDGISWTYVGQSDHTYIWEQDANITYPIDGDKKLTIKKDMQGKSIIVDIYNFRWEKLMSFTNDNSSTIDISINDEVNEKLLKGVYYCTVFIVGSDNRYLQNKYMLVVE